MNYDAGKTLNTPREQAPNCDVMEKVFNPNMCLEISLTEGVTIRSRALTRIAIALQFSNTPHFCEGLRCVNRIASKLWEIW